MQVKLTNWQQCIDYFESGQIITFPGGGAFGNPKQIYVDPMGRRYPVLKESAKITDNSVRFFELGPEIQSERKELIPHQLTPPGHILAKELEARGMTFADLGNGDEWDVEYWRRVCEGSQEIRLMSSFIRLEEVLGIPAEFWVNAQLQYSRWVLAKLSESGQRGSEAGELLRHVTKTLYSPSELVRARMDAYGIRSYDNQGQCLPLQNIFAQMRSAFKGLSEAELNQELGKIFGEIALNTAIALLNDHTQSAAGK